jgi:hypothetical protein
VIRTARGPIRWWLKATGFAGIVLPPFGAFILAERMGDMDLRRHEEVHLAQAKRYGTIGFYTRYLWLAIRHGYRNHPMEREARGEFSHI